MFGNIGLPELIIIFVIILLIFGGRKLPEVGQNLGKAIRSFKDGISGPEKDLEKMLEKEPEKEPEKASPAAPSLPREGEGAAPVPGAPQEKEKEPARKA